MYPAMMLDSMIAGEWNMQPSRVKGVCNADTGYYKRQLYHIIYGRYDFTLPKKSADQVKWEPNWFKLLLFGFGSAGVFYTRKYGWLPMPYAVLRINEQYNPQVIQGYYANYSAPGPKGVIGINAGIVKIYDDYFGVDDLVTHYATKLADFDKGINVNLINTSLGLYMEVESPKEGQDVKKAYAEATTGKPLVVAVSSPVKGGKGHEYKTMLANPKQNYLGTEFLEGRRTIIDQFLTDIGIRNANRDKRERLIQSEVESNTEETSINRDYILDNIREGFYEINKISGLGLKVEPHRTEVQNEQRDNINGLLSL